MAASMRTTWAPAGRRSSGIVQVTQVVSVLLRVESMSVTWASCLTRLPLGTIDLLYAEPSRRIVRVSVDPGTCEGVAAVLAVGDGGDVGATVGVVGGGVRGAGLGLSLGPWVGGMLAVAVAKVVGAGGSAVAQPTIARAPASVTPTTGTRIRFTPRA